MTLLLLFGLGRFLIWFIQNNGWTKRLMEANDFLNELVTCDFCLGCWVLPMLAWWFNVNLLEPFYLPFISHFLTGIIASFFLHLARIGYETNYGTTYLE